MTTESSCVSDSEKAYREWVAQAQNSCYTNLDMWNSCWEISQARLKDKINWLEDEIAYLEDIIHEHGS